MRLLLDTKVLLWALQDYSSLGLDARLRMKNADVIFVSPGSILEIRIKDEAGRLTLPQGLLDVVVESGFSELPVKWEAADAIGDLEMLEGDTFDRLLVAQAMQEQLKLVTDNDILLKAYPELCLDARV